MNQRDLLEQFRALVTFARQFRDTSDPEATGIVLPFERRDTTLFKLDVYADAAYIITPRIYLKLSNVTRAIEFIEGDEYDLCDLLHKVGDAIEMILAMKRQ
jgi:hypothetical protein